jgi:hypothetical protein
VRAMTAKKKPVPKFTGELAEPILSQLDGLIDGQLGPGFYRELGARPDSVWTA